MPDQVSAVPLKLAGGPSPFCLRRPNRITTGAIVVEGIAAVESRSPNYFKSVEKHPTVFIPPSFAPVPGKKQ
jgi:hypothetical protein